eukprot:SAG22_NODE_1487_length_4318_cov_1.548471_2_plen_984_part_01
MLRAISGLLGVFQLPEIHLGLGRSARAGGGWQSMLGGIRDEVMAEFSASATASLAGTAADEEPAADSDPSAEERRVAVLMLLCSSHADAEHSHALSEGMSTVLSGALAAVAAADSRAYMAPELAFRAMRLVGAAGEVLLLNPEWTGLQQMFAAHTPQDFRANSLSFVCRYARSLAAAPSSTISQWSEIKGAFALDTVAQLGPGISSAILECLVELVCEQFAAASPALRLVSTDILRTKTTARTARDADWTVARSILPVLCKPVLAAHNGGAPAAASVPIGFDEVWSAVSNLADEMILDDGAASASAEAVEQLTAFVTAAMGTAVAACSPDDGQTGAIGITRARHLLHVAALVFEWTPTVSDTAAERITAEAWRVFTTLVGPGISRLGEPRLAARIEESLTSACKAAIGCLLHPKLMAQPKLLGQMLDQLLTVGRASCVFMSTLQLHCFRLWGTSSRAAARPFVREIADFCTGEWDQRDGLAAPEPVAAEAEPRMQQVVDTERRLVVRATAELFLESLVEEVRRSAAETDGGGSDAEARGLCDELTAVLVERATELNYVGQGQARLGSPRHKRTVAVWQSLTILVAVVDPQGQLASRLHDAAAAAAHEEHVPNERQFVEVFMIRLVGRCPQLVGRWLPAALEKFGTRPIIAQGLMFIACFTLLQLAELTKGGDGDDAAAAARSAIDDSFPRIFSAIITWINSGHRQLRSLAQVATVKLVAEPALGGGLAVASSADPQLRCLLSYLQSSSEGAGFRQRLGAVVDECEAVGVSGFAEPERLCGRLNYEEANGNLGERSLPIYPVGKGGELEGGDAAKAAGMAARDGGLEPVLACWLAPPLIAALRAALAEDVPPVGSVPARSDPWASLAVGWQRVVTAPRRAWEPVTQPSDRGGAMEPAAGGGLLPGADEPELVICASLVDKVANIAGLCRTAEVLRASRLAVDKADVVTHKTFRGLAMGAELRLPVEEVPIDWLEAWLVEQVREE